MKRIILFAAGLALLFACDPVEMREDLVQSTITEQELADGVTFKQYSDEAHTTPASDGNYVTFNAPVPVVIYTMKADGSESTVFRGSSSGAFAVFPKRGASPEVDLYVKAMNPDRTFAITKKTLTLAPPAAIPDGVYELVGGNGAKTWTWDYAADGCWGNLGGESDWCDGAAFAGGVISGGWWGCPTPEELVDQMGHSDTGTPTGEESSGAYMVFEEDGTLTTYNAEGKVIRSAKFSISGFDKTRGEKNWQIAKLTTDAPAILFPFSINEGGKTVTEFDIMDLTQNTMTLVYDKGPAGEWHEMTWWKFKQISDPNALINGGSSKKWGWTTSATGVWGNLGGESDWCSGADFAGGVISGSWWGCTTPEELIDQMNHSDTGKPTGEEDSGAYMVFNDDGEIVSYSATGAKIREATYAIEGYDRTRGEKNWQLGKLKTSAPAVLFPFSINEGGKTVTEFDIMDLTPNSMTLVYDKGPAGEWHEMTWWKFQAIPE